ncbi:hypothetical protein ACF0H5_008046 [Mactra antiquata]
MKNAHHTWTNGDASEKKLTNESLLLPCVSGAKSTSASIAERSNLWVENKLCERKVNLDQKLHRSIVKLNVDMLEITEELTKLNRMKKSASSGALDKMDHLHDHHHLNHSHTLMLKGHVTKGKSSTPSSPCVNRHPMNSLGSRVSSTSDRTKRDKNAQSNKTDNHRKYSDNKSKIAITIDSASSSDDNSDGDKKKAESKRKIVSALACQNGQPCSTRRSERQTFENKARRYKNSHTDSVTKLKK